MHAGRTVLTHFYFLRVCCDTNVVTAVSTQCCCTSRCGAGMRDDEFAACVTQVSDQQQLLHEAASETLVGEVIETLVDLINQQTALQQRIAAVRRATSGDHIQGSNAPSLAPRLPSPFYRYSRPGNALARHRRPGRAAWPGADLIPV